MNIKELRDAVGVGRMLSPAYHGKNLIEIRCYNAFEGHGRASETWEEHWEIVLPQHQYYWLTNEKRWRMGKPGIKQKFHGRSLERCLQMAEQYLREIGEVARTYAESDLQSERA